MKPLQSPNLVHFAKWLCIPFLKPDRYLKLATRVLPERRGADFAIGSKRLDDTRVFAIERPPEVNQPHLGRLFSQRESLLHKEKE